MLNIKSSLVLPTAADDKKRAETYDLLSDLLQAPPDKIFLEYLADLSVEDADFSHPLRVLSQAARRVSPAQVAEEFSVLFGGNHTRVHEIHPTASAHYVGPVDEHPIIRLRTHLMYLGIEYDIDAELPADHIAVLCRIMSGLIIHAYPLTNEPAAAEEFFQTHLAEWAPDLFTQIESARSAAFYMPIGTLGRQFFAQEQQTTMTLLAA